MNPLIAVTWCIVSYSDECELKPTKGITRWDSFIYTNGIYLYIFSSRPVRDKSSSESDAESDSQASKPLRKKHKIQSLPYR